MYRQTNETAEVVVEAMKREASWNKLILETEVLNADQGSKAPSVKNVARALSGIPHLLVGGHAINLHVGKPRATVDVDVVVGDVDKATLAIQRNFPELRVEENPGEDVTRFTLDGVEVVNLLHPVGNFGAMLKNGSVKLPLADKSSNVSVPSFENLLVAKYLSMNSMTRDPEGKARDRMDLISLIKSRPDTRDGIDMRKLSAVWKGVKFGDDIANEDEQGLSQLIYQVRKEQRDYQAALAARKSNVAGKPNWK